MMKSQRNNYKIGFAVLLCVVVVGCLFLGFNYSTNKAFEKGVLEGENLVIEKIIYDINQDGQVKFVNDKGEELSLVPVNVAIKVRENTILEIIDLVNKEGFVNLYTNESQLVLVPYVAPQEQ